MASSIPYSPAPHHFAAWPVRHSSNGVGERYERFAGKRAGAVVVGGGQVHEAIEGRAGAGEVERVRDGRVHADGPRRAQRLGPRAQGAAAVVAFDDAQFLGPGIGACLRLLLRQGKLVIAAGLDFDFRDLPLPATTEFLSLATKVNKPFAVCTDVTRSDGRAPSGTAGSRRSPSR